MIVVFKAFLLLCVVLFTYLAVFRLRTPLVQRALAVPLGLALCVLAIAPDLSSVVAHFFGIGRGSDLVFYLAHVTEAFFLLILYARYQNLSLEFAELVRRQALDRAEPPRVQ
jgi:hypothetical protein